MAAAVGLLAAAAQAQFTVYTLPAAPAQVAELETEVPTATSFILRGTLPIPRNVFSPGGARSLKIVDWNGNLLSTQCEVVTRFPGTNGVGGHADVVELIARVGRDPAWIPGNGARYRVVQAADTAQPAPTNLGAGSLTTVTKPVPANIQGLIGDSKSIVIRAIDPQGKRYLMYPLKAGNWKAYRYGTEMTTLRSYGPLLPDFTSAANEYPHLMGVHTYFTTRKSDAALMLDLRIHNGFDNFDATTTTDDHIGRCYWKRLDLLILQSPSQQWRPQFEFADPFCYQAGQAITTTTISQGGTPYTYDVFPIVNEHAPSGGLVKMHVMDYKMQFHRRLGIAASSGQTALRKLLDFEGVAFASEGVAQAGGESWSWFNPLVARYFPQRHVLPTLSFAYQPDTGAPCLGTNSLAALRCQINSRLASTSASLAGNTPFATGYDSGSLAQLGWARPYGFTDGMAVSGSAITFLEGDRAIAAASRNELRNISLRHRLTTERQPTPIWDRFGNPTQQEKWLFPNAAGVANPNLPGSPLCVSPFDFVVNWSTGVPNQFFAPTVTNWIQNQVTVNGSLVPDYQTNPTPELNLFQYQPIAQSHLVRYTRSSMALVWISNDPVSKDDLRMQGELARMQFTEYPRYNNYGYIQGESLYARRLFVNAYPAWGIHIGRTEGWGLNAANALYALADDPDRQRLRHWYGRVVSLFNDGMIQGTDPCFTNAGGTPYPWGMLSVYDGSDTGTCGQFWGGWNPVPCPRSRQPFEEMIIANGMRGMSQSVYNAAESTYTSVNSLLSKSYYGMIAPVAWDEVSNVVFNRQAVTANSPLLSPLYNYDSTWCGPCTTCPPNLDMYSLPSYWQPTGSAYHYFMSAMADAYSLTSDLIFLAKPLANLGILNPTNHAAQLKAALESSATVTPTQYSNGNYDTWSNRAVLLGRVQ